MVDNIKSALTRKLGPLPAWAWLAVTAIGIWYYRSKTSGSTAAVNTTATSPTFTPPTPQSPVNLGQGESVYDPNTGALVTAPGGGDAYPQPIALQPGTSYIDPTTGGVVTTPSVTTLSSSPVPSADPFTVGQSVNGATYLGSGKWSYNGKTGSAPIGKVWKGSRKAGATKPTSRPVRKPPAKTPPRSRATPTHHTPPKPPPASSRQRSGAAVASPGHKVATGGTRYKPPKKRG
jgi:hypothetical protein